ncbi:hypothetical protein ACFYVL_11290 [Streptomyces sp. NPDC004111]|uniref:hypothetical protein n=1 Tax=Streptomyces sp. NPDC004111 TaxID=3364690 RepID=UPI0036C5BBF9
MLSRSARSIGVAVVVGATVFGSTQASATAAVDGLQREIDKVLAESEGGVQISRNEIAWHDGEAIMTFALPGERRAPVSSPAAQRLQARAAGLPESTREREGTALAADNCPTEVFGNDWYCFYQYPNWEGRRLAWNMPKTRFVNFSDYGFVNMTSSWSNKGEMNIRVYGRTRAGDDNSCIDPLWVEAPHTTDARANADNAADCFLAA